MRLVSIRRSMEMEEKILCELMISVHRQTREDRLLKEIPLCVGRIQNGRDGRCSLEVAANTLTVFPECVSHTLITAFWREQDGE